MQLVWHDSLKMQPYCLETIKIYFSAMQSMHVGKASTHFLEKAKELENIILTNKIYQSTRFVSSLLRGLTAALRNLPTIISIIGEEYNEAVLKFNNTEAKSLKKTLDGLMSAETLFFTIGMCQLLESYCAASLESQYTSHFPIQVKCSLFSILFSKTIYYEYFPNNQMSFPLYRSCNESTLLKVSCSN